jgi:hypothetical protein
MEIADVSMGLNTDPNARFLRNGSIPEHRNDVNQQHSVH